MLVWGFRQWNSIITGGPGKPSPSIMSTVMVIRGMGGSRDRIMAQQEQRQSEMDRASQAGTPPRQRKKEQSGGVERKLEPLM